MLGLVALIVATIPGVAVAADPPDFDVPPIPAQGATLSVTAGQLLSFIVQASDVNVLASVTQITAGDDHTCALLDSGVVRCWGWGGVGQIGYGNIDSIGDNETPATSGDVDVGGTVTQIDAGDARTCAVLDTGNLRCWGSGLFSNLGYGNPNSNVGDNETPASAGSVDIGGTITQVAAGTFHTCALLTTGTVRCWGSSSNGMLGYGNTTIIGDDETPASAGGVDVVDPGDLINLGGTGLPTGAFQDVAAANPVSATFSWTAQVSDVGTHAITFTAQDSTSLFATPHVITIEVQQAPSVPGAAPWALAGLAGAFVLLLARTMRRRATAFSI